MDEQKKEKLRQKMIDSQYEYEERAAIMEFDGGLIRSEAERRAKIDLNYQGWSKINGR